MAGKKKTDTDPGSVEVTVFVPRGSVREGDIKKAALLAARDAVPVAAFDITLSIGDVSEPKTADGVEGRDYTVKIDYTPRRTTDPDGEREAVTVDKVLASLDPLTEQKLADVTGGGPTEPSEA